jgi:hypothetical protein
MQFGTNAVFRLLPPGFLLKLHFHPEDWSDLFLRNVSRLLHGFITQKIRKYCVMPPLCSENKR